MDYKLVAVIVLLCALYQTVRSTSNDLTCIESYSGNLTNICRCDGIIANNLTTQWELYCEFGDIDDDFDIHIRGNVDGVVFRGEFSLAILENITTSSNMENVTSIDVQANKNAFNVNQSFISNFSALKSIRLHNCSLLHIEPRTFVNLRNLESINLSGNDYLRLEDVIASLEDMNSPNVRHLNISGIHNAENMPTTSLDQYFFERLAGTKLEVLDMSWIRLTLITGSFTLLHHLKAINITGTTVLGETDCMATLLGLEQLETCVCNSWPTLPRGYESIVRLPEPPYRYRRSSHCHTYPLFNFTTMCWNMIRSAKTLSLRNVDLDSFYVDFTRGIFCLEENELLNFMLSGSRVTRQLSRFVGFDKLKFFDISDIVSAYQGPIIRPDTFFEMPALEVLLSRAIRLDQFPPAELSQVISRNRQLKVIDWSYNGLTYLRKDQFSENLELMSLNLSSNRLNELDLNLGNHFKLTTLDLSNNKIQSISDDFYASINAISVNRTLTIHFQANSFDCECLLVKLALTVSFDSKIECKLKGRLHSLSNLTEETIPVELDQLCHPIAKGLTVTEIFGISFGSVMVFVVILVIIICVSRSSGFTGNNLTLITLPVSNQRRQEPKFTVFLAYCYKDYEFAVLKLYPALNKRLKVLLKSDDDNLIIVNDNHFLPGVNIDVLIANAIQESYVTLAVISKDFLASSWCKYEVIKSFTENVPLIPLYISKLDPSVLCGISKELYFTRTRLLWPGNATSDSKKQEKEEKDTIEMLCKSILGHVVQTKQCIAANRRKHHLDTNGNQSETSLPRYGPPRSISEVQY